MRRSSKVPLCPAITAVAVLAVAALCAYSGGERLTKSSKAVTIIAADDLFGDSQPRVELRRGPVFGWYVGWDAVGAAVLAAALSNGIVFWGVWRGRRAARGDKGVQA